MQYELYKKVALKMQIICCYNTPLATAEEEGAAR